MRKGPFARGPFPGWKAADAVPLCTSVEQAEFSERLACGSLAELVDGHGCLHEDCSDPVRLTKRRVTRGVVLLVGSAYVFLVLVVPLAKCRAGHWCRVLPAGVLPYKVYGVRAHEFAIAMYSRGDLGLRAVVVLCIGNAPHYTTLWGWLGGLGGMALGRAGNTPAAPFATVREEAKRRLLPQLDAIWEQPYVVNPARVQWPRQAPRPGKQGVSKNPRSRLEQLEAVGRLLRTAAAVARAAGIVTRFALAALVGLTVGFDIVPGMSWGARFRVTSFQLCSQSGSSLASPVVHGLGNKEAACPRRSRAPPGNAA